MHVVMDRCHQTGTAVWWWPLDVVVLVPWFTTCRERRKKNLLETTRLEPPFILVESVSRTFFPVVGRAVVKWRRVVKMGGGDVYVVVVLVTVVATWQRVEVVFELDVY